MRSPISVSSEPEEYAGSESVSISLGTFNSSADNILLSDEGVQKRNSSTGVDASVSVSAVLDSDKRELTPDRIDEECGKSTVSTGTSPPPQNMSTQVISILF